MKKTIFLKSIFIFLFSLTLNHSCSANFWDNWVRPTAWCKWVGNGLNHLMLKPSINLIQEGHLEWNQIRGLESKVNQYLKAITGNIKTESDPSRNFRLQETKRCFERYQRNIWETKRLLKKNQRWHDWWYYPKHDEISRSGIDYNSDSAAKQIEYLRKLTELKAKGINDLDACINQVNDPDSQKKLQNERDRYKKEFNGKRTAVVIEQMKYYTYKALTATPWWVKYVGGGLIATYLAYKLIYRPARFVCRWWIKKTPNQLQRNIESRLGNGANAQQIADLARQIAEHNNWF